MENLLVAARLSFASPELEARFCDHRTTTYFFAVDSYSAVYRAAIPTVIFCQRLLKREADSPVLPLLVVGLTALFLNLSVLMAAFPRPWTIRWREPVTAFLRGTIVPMTVMMCYLEGDHLPHPLTWKPYIFNAIFSAGLTMTCLFPLAMPLHLKHHIPVHLAVWLMIVNIHVPRFCHALAERHDAHTFVMQSWEALSTRVWGLLDSMYGGVPVEPCPPTVAVACRHMHTCVQLVFGLVVTTYMVWVLEYQSRAFFLQREIREGRVPGGRTRKAWPAMPLSAIVCHAALLPMLFAVCWVCLAHALFAGNDAQYSQQGCEVG
ncbi:unnamed protein product [Ostreobium quekettii]|uniref:Uncharacterized protein n=1 Tax=Ostreobium quekettii TaxID=121088 RepID=A0A8S1JEZ3_9CHLO|nr:unnamed protein product [Ostreobium quekettii]|eukprot:evm.model.scf_14.6 EVM.evm.TU.scf_14.6   scf_14:92408-97428(-)